MEQVGGRWVDRAMGRWWWLASLALLAALVAAILVVNQLSPVDRPQQLRLVRWVAEGHLRGAFRRTAQTSGPGMAVTTPVYLAARRFASPGTSYVVAALSCLVALAIAAVAALRAAGVVARSPRELAGLSLVLTGVPVLGCYLEAFHPSDVLATAAVLGAYAAVVRHRMGWAAALLGFGLATRQWVIVAVALLAVLETGWARWVLALGSVATFVALVVPFAIADPRPTLYVLSAKGTMRSFRSLPGLLPLSDDANYLVSRYVPLVVVFLVCWWLRDRHAEAGPAMAIAALAFGLSIRAAVDPAGFGYYAAPGYAAMVVVLVGAFRSTVGAACLFFGGLVLWARARSFGFPHWEYTVRDGVVVGQRIIEQRSVAWASVETLLFVGLASAATIVLWRAGSPAASRTVERESTALDKG